MGDVIRLARACGGQQADLDEVERLVVKLLRTVEPERVPVVLAAAGHRVPATLPSRATRT